MISHGCWTSSSASVIFSDIVAVFLLPYLVNLADSDRQEMANQNGRPSEPPPVPQHRATTQEVEDFLKAYFKSQLCLSDAACLELAQRLPTDGSGLYCARESQLCKVYGPIGTPLFCHLQKSIYGHVCLMSHVLCPMSLILSYYRLPNKRKDQADDPRGCVQVATLPHPANSAVNTTNAGFR